MGFVRIAAQSKSLSGRWVYARSSGGNLQLGPNDRVKNATTNKELRNWFEEYMYDFYAEL